MKLPRFTLAALLAVAVGSAVLASAAFALARASLERARAEGTSALIGQLQAACEQYRVQCGAYPPMAFEGSKSLHRSLRSPSKMVFHDAPTPLPGEPLPAGPPYLEFTPLMLQRGSTTDATSPSLIVDAWNRPIGYRNPGVRHPLAIDIWSLGPDGVPSLDDIYNWVSGQ